MIPEIDVSGVILRTRRLILRPWRQTDLEDFYTYASVPELGPMAGWKPHANREESQRILDRFISGRKTFALEYRGRVVGSLGVEGYDEEQYPEFAAQRVRALGFVLAKDCWGRGLMPEAANAVIRWLFEEMDLDLILCGHFLWNRQSLRVQEKCGFRHYAFGVFHTKTGKAEDHELRILTREDWLRKICESGTLSEKLDTKEKSPMTNYDLIVIGAGPGGYEAALHAAKLGLKTALVERRDVGGTCLNRGCIPTKTLLHSAELYHEAKEAGTFGIHTENVGYDLPAIFARKQAVVEKLRGGVEALLKSAKVELLRGTGTVLGSGRVRVSNAEGETEYTCDKILCATGSVPARPPIPGLELAMTSDELLDGAETLYQSLIIIGGGVIGVELATFYADLGCPVTIVEGLDRLLPNMDKELGQNLAMLLKKRGVSIQTGAMVQGVEKSEKGLTVRYEQKGKPGAVEAEAVLCAIGRAPYSQGLFAEGLEPAYDRRRVHVDEHFQTSIPGVYAIGDVSSPVQLAHVATAQGIACVDEIAGRSPGQDLSLVPGCVYTRPEIATVGVTEAEAKEKGIPFKTAKGLMSANGRTVILEGERGFMKLVANAETGKLIGAALMCERATDMISQLTAAMANGLTVKQMLGLIRPHPTFEEALGGALEELAKKLEL